MKYIYALAYTVVMMAMFLRDDRAMARFFWFLLCAIGLIFLLG